MKKKNILIVVTLIIVMVSTFTLVDYNRAKANKNPVFVIPTTMKYNN